MEAVNLNQYNLYFDTFTTFIFQVDDLKVLSVVDVIITDENSDLDYQQ